MRDHYGRLICFLKEQVADNETFFIVGSGGIAVTHQGTTNVRDVMAYWRPAFDQCQTPQEREELLVKVFNAYMDHIKFVILVKKFLHGYHEDVRHGTHRNFAPVRVQSILYHHGGIERIQRYPRDSYIEVGRLWVKDILERLSRDRRLRPATNAQQAPLPEPDIDELTLLFLDVDLDKLADVGPNQDMVMNDA